ncbi:hypothetical protein F2Q69_00037908 [Brassica cretica]|uniref:F-box domain-containing protein n=1 Tax=Brassica cretica TaxID=69181 RepID=A0A8S9SF97_BRACR|nr:hypothetical protein F2Q69_00037908 [Brassica cretica]
MTMISDLPGDLFEDILSRVPAISLKRLRSSCKRWNRLFNNKEFARKHLHKAPKQSFFLTVTKDYYIYLMTINHRGIRSIQSKGELSPIDCERIIISEVFHCDGLLLCTFDNKTRIMLWNSFTGQTSWGIQPFCTSHTYALGSYQESRYGNCSYKILSYKDDSVHEFAIYEINSNSWRILDVVQDFRLLYIETFDYTTERFGRLSLPCNCPLDCFRNAAISVVSEEKLAVLLLRKNTWEKEIWISNKIDGTKEVSWRKFVTVDYPKDDVWISITRFLLNEEKKVALCCETCISDRFTTMMKKLIYIAGEDHKVKIMASGEVTSGSFWPIVLDFVPSLVQIPASGCNRKNRGD